MPRRDDGPKAGSIRTGPDADAEWEAYEKRYEWATDSADWKGTECTYHDLRHASEICGMVFKEFGPDQVIAVAAMIGAERRGEELAEALGGLEELGSIDERLLRIAENLG